MEFAYWLQETRLQPIFGSEDNGNEKHSLEGSVALVWSMSFTRTLSPYLPPLLHVVVVVSSSTNNAAAGACAMIW